MVWLRARLRWVLIASVLGVIAAACGEAAEPAADEPAPAETTGTAGAASASAAPAGALGSVTLAPGEPIVISSMQTISGATASLGEDQVRAIEIAIAERGGELLGHPLQLQSEDELCSAEGGTTAAQKIVSDPQQIAVLGTSCSGAGVPASQIVSEAGLVMISGSNTSPSLTAEGYFAPEGPSQAENWQPGYFRVSHNDEYQGRGAAQFAVDELGATTAATIHDGDPYTEGLTSAFTASFEEFGGEIVMATAVNKGDTDMRPVLTEIAAANPDLIYFPIFQPEADYIVQQLQEFDELSSDTIMGADGLLADTFVVIPETAGMYFSGPSQAEGAAYDEFVAAYEEAHGEAPIQAFHAHSYDAANMLFDTLEQVAQEQDDGSVVIDRQALRDALYAVEGFQGLTGSLTCNEFGDCADPRISIFLNDQAESIEAVRDNLVYIYEPDEEQPSAAASE
jgi:branched-chain amino acid transport system substrate-binding protein